MSARAIRVLVADDSPLCAEALRSVIDADPRMRVVGIAHDGLRAVELAAALRPTVITMDVHMPRLDGLGAIARIRAAQPARILVVTGDDARGLAFEALRRGAADVVRRPHPREGWSPGEHEDLRRRIVALAQPPRAVARAARSRVIVPERPPEGRIEVVGIAGSTGGPVALARLLGGLGERFPAPILVVQHLAPGFAPGFAQWLDRGSPLRVALAREGETIVPGDVRIAPDGVHLVLDRGGRVRLEEGTEIDGHRPSATRLFTSLAPYGARAAGVVLSGMGRDGAAGLAELRRAGGVVLAQDEASCVVYGMPKAAVEAGAAAETLAPERISARLVELAERAEGE